MIYIFEHIFGCDLFLVINGVVVYHVFDAKAHVQSLIDASEPAEEIEADILAEMDAMAYHSDYVGYVLDLSVNSVAKAPKAPKIAKNK